MARYTDSQCRLCRREGQKLFLKGDRCYSDKCSFSKRPTPPGQHGSAGKPRNQKNYGIQLREKQKMRRIYGVLEGQFRKYFSMAEKMPGIVGENFLSILERRFDNVVFRMGLASSRSQARQLVNHGHITLNGKKADIPSILVKPGDVIAGREKSRSSVRIKEIVETNAKRVIPSWLDMNRDTLTGKVVRLSEREDIDYEVAEHLIVELYSK